MSLVPSVVVDDAGTSDTDRIAEAYATGFAEGRAEGEQAERARLRAATRAVEEAGEAIDAADARWTGNAEENVITVAIAVARHIIDRELATDMEGVARLVKRALAEFPIDQPLRVRLHPDDLAVIESLEDESSRESIDAGRATQWIGDTRITPGGCVVEGRERIIDGRIEPALERVYRRLTHAQDA